MNSYLLCSNLVLRKRAEVYPFKHTVRLLDLGIQNAIESYAQVDLLVVISEPNKSEIGYQEGALVPIISLGVFNLIYRIDYDLTLPWL
jgi:hypothetical protein